MKSPTILITGTSRGLGKDLAQYYIDKKYNVIGCSRSEAQIEHSLYRHFSLSVSNEDQVINLFHKIKADYGGLDFLINNAGAASLNHSLTTPLETFDRIYHTNVRGTFLFTKEASKIMSKKEFGRIVNITSIAVPLALEGESCYGASKAAVEHLTKVMAKEFAAFGITINAIGPCLYETSLIKGLTENKRKEILKKQMIPRFCQFSDIIQGIEFFMDPKSSFYSGQIIYLGV